MFNAGNAYVSFTSGDGVEHYYWGGAMGNDKSCACGTTHSCEEEGVKCNCDILDGKKRFDFGYIIDRSHLPIVKVTINNLVGANSTTRIRVGSLRCSQKQFGKVFT